MIVKPRYSPRTKMIIASTIAFLVIVGSAGIYNYGLNTAGFQKMLASKAVSQLEDKITRLESENQELREGLARAERTLQMDQTAYKDLDRSLQASSGEIARLREELNFYRNIISPPNKKAGLRIQSLNIEKAKKASHYRYKLVLIQALKHDYTIYGHAKFEVSGLQAGKNTVLNFPGSGAKPVRVNFRYFQDVEGELELPLNFQPKQIKVSVTTTGRGAQTVEQTYEWPNA